jgi:hypothetical protein
VSAQFSLSSKGKSFGYVCLQRIRSSRSRWPPRMHYAFGCPPPTHPPAPAVVGHMYLPHSAPPLVPLVVGSACCAYRSLGCPVAALSNVLCTEALMWHSLTYGPTILCPPPHTAGLTWVNRSPRGTSVCHR